MHPSIENKEKIKKQSCILGINYFFLFFFMKLCCILTFDSAKYAILKTAEVAMLYGGVNHKIFLFLLLLLFCTIILSSILLYMSFFYIPYF